MSKFSGKCDFADSISIWTKEDDSKIDEFLAKSRIYIGFGANQKKLDLHCYKDAIPYLPYIVAMSSCDKNDAYINLSDRSFVDQENDELMDGAVKWYKRKRDSSKRKCKKLNMEFDVKSFTEEYIKNDSMIAQDEAFVSVINAIASGKKIEKYPYRRMALFYREELRKEMDKYGLNPAVYGY